MKPPSALKARAPNSSHLRAELKSAGSTRLALVGAMVKARIPLDVATRTADVLLLAGLAAEELGIGGAAGAFGSVESRDFGPVADLVLAVERRAGVTLGLASEAVDGLRRGLQAPLPFPAFRHLRMQPDSFGLLAQDLRGQSVVKNGGEIGLEPSESRRNNGGYYTPFPIARRLVEHTLSDLEEIPAVIDPACGAGTFLSAAFDVLFARWEARRRHDPASEIDSVAWAVAALHGVELDPTALIAAQLSLVVRALKADSVVRASGQMALFRQTVGYGALIQDRLRLGDALMQAPHASLSGTERLRLRLMARDVPGRLPRPVDPEPIAWERAFPLRFSDEEGVFVPGGFDVVVTNPPFVPVDRIPTEHRRKLMASLQTAHRRFDLFIGFVERAFTLLRPDGRATLLIPRTFLTETNAEPCRRLLAEKCTVERIEDLGALAFDEARVPCIALTFRARKPGPAAQVQLIGLESKPQGALAQALFEKTPRGSWRLDLAKPEAADCLRLAEVSVPLGKYFCASWGARGSPVEKFHLDSPDHPCAKPMIKGDDIQPLLIAPSSRWLLYDPEQLYRPARREMFEAEKIVVRKVTGKRGLVCAVDVGRHYTDDSLACVVRKADLIAIPKADRKRHQISISEGDANQSRGYDLNLVAVLLQTPLVQRYYKLLLGGGLNVFPESIEELPLPRPERLALPVAEALARLGREAAKGAVVDLASADAAARELFGLDASVD